jgi:hypothetical protein
MGDVGIFCLIGDVGTAWACLCFKGDEGGVSRIVPGDKAGIAVDLSPVLLPPLPGDPPMISEIGLLV